MCLAVPARIEEVEDDSAWVRVGKARMKASLVLTPEATLGDWVLVHAGFAIQQLDEEAARETWKLLDEIESATREMSS